MLTFDCFKSRLEKGLSFLEFNYMLMQSYDFYRLFLDYNCKMQLGGDDQWANIIGGIELIRKTTTSEAYGITFTLLTTSEGKKMGKTQNGAVWLDAEKTSPYNFFQYWRNVDDADVIKLLRMITFVPLERIEELALLEGSELNKAKELLAYELTKLVHGEIEADKALEATRALFVTGGNSENMPSTTLSQADFTNGRITILELLFKSGLSASKGDARRLVEQGGIAVNESKITSLTEDFGIDDFSKTFIIKKGKKMFHKFIVE